MEKFLKNGENQAMNTIVEKNGLEYTPTTSQNEYISFLGTYLKDLKASPSIKLACTLSTKTESNENGYGIEEIHFGNKLTSRLKDTAQDQKVTLELFLQSIWALLINYYNQEDDVIFGVEENCKECKKQNLFLPFRVIFHKDQTIQDLLKQAKSYTVSIARHKKYHTPHADSIAKISSLSLYNSVFIIRSSTSSKNNSKTKKGNKYHLVTEISLKNDGRIQVRLSYNKKIFSNILVKNLLCNYKTLSQKIIKNVKQNTNSIDIISKNEKFLILNNYIQTQENKRKRSITFSKVCVHELFEGQAISTPEAVAVVYQDRTLSYARLNNQANKLAHYLVKKGVKRDSLVAVYLDRSPEMIIAVLGILKAGGAYVPLDIHYPEERLQFMLDDAATSIIITQKNAAKTLNFDNKEVIYLEENSSLYAAEPSFPPPTKTTEANIAYILYTSGSTGKPKGVMMPHQALTNLIVWQQTEIREKRNILQFTTLSFDMSFLEIFSALCFGGTCVLIPENSRIDLEKFSNVIKKHAVQQLMIPVSFLQKISESDINKDRFHTLREIITAGEQLVITPEIRSFFTELSLCKLKNYYGPSETHVATSYQMQDHPSEWPTHPPIGRTIANTKIYILNKNKQLAPIGALGEIYIGGMCLAKGYWRREKLTAEKFIQDPWSNNPSDRLYRTGDIAKYSAEGNIIFIGRVDNQVKIRGFRIELEEIEEILMQHPSVMKSIVIPDTNAKEGKLIAYYTKKKSGKNIPNFTEKLRRTLSKKLPAYMMPNLFCEIQSFPTLPNGKIDRQSLPVPDSILLSGNAYSTPCNEIEKSLVEIWYQSLHVSPISIHDNFFLLGGHSINAMQITSQINRLFRIDIPVSAIFENNTIKRLATIVRKAIKSEKIVSKTVKLNKRIKKLSPSLEQRKLLFLDNYEKHKAVYNIPIAIKLVGVLDIQSLKQSFNMLIKRHQALSVSFKNVEYHPTLDVGKVKPFKLSVKKLSKGKIIEALQSEVNKKFNLRNPPLLRAKLFQLNTREHILVITLHHIISDGRSIEIIKQELSECYAAYLHKEDPKLLKMEAQYFDLIDWQKSATHQAKIREQLKYWKTKLQNFSHLNMSTDFPRPPKQSYSGDCYRFTFEKNLIAKISLLSVKNNVTLFMTVLAVFNILLSRYSGQDDIVIGTAIDNRGLSGSENVFGFFVNTLVLRSQLSGNLNFNSLLQQVKQTSLEAYANQYAPFDFLVDELKIERSAACHPIFQVMLVWPNTNKTEKFNFPNLKTSQIPIDTKTAKFDLTFEFVFNNSKLECQVEYNTDIYRQSTIQRMAGHLQQLLRSIATDQTKPIHAYQILTALEKRKILTDWNHPNKLKLIPQKIHHLFSAQANKTPHNVALVFQDHQLTYQELDKRSTQLAHLLREEYKKNHQAVIENPIFIGLCVERSLEMVVGILAVLKAGAAYVPLDPNLPIQRLKFMMEDANCQLILTQEAIKKKIFNNLIPANEKHRLIICLDELGGIHRHMEVPTLEPLQKTSDLAYVIYTSGTTGKPKGVKQTHRNIQRLLAVTKQNFNFNAKDVWTLFHSYAFDFSVWEIFGSLLHGGCLIIPTYEQTRDPELFRKLIIGKQVTILNQTPSAFQAFMQEDLMSDEKKTTLRYIIFGGEALKIEKLALWWNKYEDHHPQLVNMYGITETTVHTTYKLLKKSNLISKEISNIGKPLSDLTAYIVDKHLNLLPVGIPGELLIGNAGLAEGYLNRPELTNEKFIDSPFLSSQEKAQREATGAETRLYRSGDLARWLDDGSLEYLGRIDNQVKIRGFRIELGEIESILNAHPAILQSVAQIIEHGSVKQLVAYYVVKKNISDKKEKPIYDQLVECLKNNLPSYMLPSMLVELKEIPLTKNMKLDLAALPQLETLNAPPDNNLYTKKMTKFEKLLLAIWQKVLRKKNIRINENFFNIGGDSMSSIRIVYLAKQKGLYFSVSDIFQFQTIKELAKKCDTRNKIDSDPNIKRIAPFALIDVRDKKKLARSVEDAYPQAALQTGMLYHSITSPATAVYLDVFSYYVHARYVDEYFRQVLSFMISENPVLRTSFNITDFSQPIQIIHRVINPSITITNLVHLTEQQQEKQLDIWMKNEKLTPFDHKEPPLFRIGIHLISENKFVLGFSFHHAILDGWSVATFLTNLLKKYKSTAASKDQRKKPVADRGYKKFIQLEQESAMSLEHKEFWKNELKNLQPTQLMPWPNTKRPDLMTEVIIPISDKLSESLQLLAKISNVSLDIILICAHIKLLSILTSSDDITTGVVFNGRPEIKDSEKTLGLFLNSLPFRQHVTNCSWKELVLAVSAKKTSIYPYRHYPLSKIYENYGSQDLFDILFYFVNFHVYKELNEKEAIKLTARSLYERTNFPLVFLASVDQESNKLSCVLKYQTKIYPHFQIKDLAQHYQKVLTVMVNSFEKSHSEIDLLSLKEKHKIINTWNDTEEHYTLEKRLINLFEEQVKEVPNKIAAIYEKDHLTYRDLNQKANQLARHLNNIGVKAGTKVIVYMERSIDILIAGLAIWKVGAVYVPLDLSYPDVRSSFILYDTGSKFILTQKFLVGSSNFLSSNSELCIYLDEISFDLKKLPKEKFIVKTKSQDLAYVIYTSGSTGRPKGVMIKHNSLANLLLSACDQTLFTQHDVFLALASLSFDISLLELYMPLICGASCVIGGRITAKDPSELIRVLQENQVTAMQATPTTWRMLFDHGWENAQNIKILSGGEALPKDLAQKMAACSQRRGAWNLYGPTETTIWSTLCQIKDVPSHDYYPIGRPLANTKVLIINDNQKLSPIGVTGELCIGGIGLASGYLNNAELTKEKFIDGLLPIGKETKVKEGGEKFYRTGDLAQWMPDGNVRYMGRIDDQIKIRGHRIEVGEIEFILLQHKKIKQCVVTTSKNNNQEQLICYIVLHEGSFFKNSSELNNFIRENLPYYMVPEKFFILKELPININGKVDKNQLAKQTAIELAPTYCKHIPPKTSEQIKLAKIWCEILNVEAVSINDDFFNLGGNSLLTLKMIKSVKHTFQVDLSLRHIIESPTLEKLSTQILALENGKEEEMTSNMIGFTKKMPDPIVTLKDKGHKKPLFLIHPVGGGLFYYLPLVKKLGDDRPVYGIQDPGLEARDLLFHSLKEMATFYIVAIKRYQPTGPYFIGGSSFGANVAVEMARQLIDQGDKVAFVGLIDGIAKYPEEVTKDRDSFDKVLRSQIPYLHTQLPGVNIPDLFLELHWHRQQIMAQHTIPKLTDLKLTLFKATEILDILKAINSETNLWDQYNPKSLEVYKVPGNHLTMHFEPHIDILAKMLRKRLIDINL